MERPPLFLSHLTTLRPMEIQTNDPASTRDPLTVKEAAAAYQALNSLDPGALGKELTTDVVEIADTLEDVVRKYQAKGGKHRERLAGEDGELTEDAEEELSELMEEIGEEETSLRPVLDPGKAPSVRAMRELMALDPLKPILP